MQYIISPITTYNEDEVLYETKIGQDSKSMPLLYVAYGKTEHISRLQAQSLVTVLNEITAHQVI